MIELYTKSEYNSLFITFQFQFFSAASKTSFQKILRNYRLRRANSSDYKIARSTSHFLLTGFYIHLLLNARLTVNYIFVAKIYSTVQIYYWLVEAQVNAVHMPPNHTSQIVSCTRARVMRRVERSGSARIYCKPKCLLYLAFQRLGHLSLSIDRSSNNNNKKSRKNTAIRRRQSYAIEIRFGSMNGPFK